MIGLNEPIANLSTLVRIIALVIIIPSIFMHLYFVETVLSSERHGMALSLCHIISENRVFCNLKMKYCRTGLFFLYYCQGFNFFDAGYSYELVNAGFSRNTSNTIGNVISVPILIMAFYMADWAKYIGINRTNISITFLLIISYSAILIIFPLNPYVVTLVSLFT